MQIVLDVHPRRSIVADERHGKHHRNCEGHDDENRVGKTRSQSYRSATRWNVFEVFLSAQWTLGRSPNWDQSFFDSDNETPDPSFLEHLQGMETAREAWLKARNDARIKRASRSRDRPLAHFRPGDEGDFWRRGKGKGTRPHIKGRFHGGAVVLATSTEIDEEDGSRKPRKVVWITHAGNADQMCT